MGALHFPGGFIVTWHCLTSPFRLPAFIACSWGQKSLFGSGCGEDSLMGSPYRSTSEPRSELCPASVSWSSAETPFIVSYSTCVLGYSFLFPSDPFLLSLSLFFCITFIIPDPIGDTFLFYTVIINSFAHFL